MLDSGDRAVLNQVRRIGDESEPTWREPWATYVLIAGGLLLIVTDAIRVGSLL